jgi:spermidine synthase
VRQTLAVAEEMSSVQDGVEFNPTVAGASTRVRAERGPLRALAWVYFCSGFSALVYQVVWQRALSTHFGVGPISTTLIVSVFMAGLGLGSHLGGVLTQKVADRITAYFLVELALGVFGASSLGILQLAGPFIAQSSFAAGLAVVAGFLLLPTVLMGMTFPLLTQIFVERDPRLGAAVSRLYFVNTLGAAFGALSSSVVLVSFFGLDVALYVAAAINLALAGGIQLARRVDQRHASAGIPPAAADDTPLERFPIALVFVTGFVAIGYQMLWFRMVGILVKDSPYAFSGILATYLLGIACGSLWVHRALASRRLKSPRQLYFGLQVAIGLYALGVALAVYWLRDTAAFEALMQVSFRADTHPPKIAPGVFTSPRRLFLLFDIFFWSLLLFFPATLFMGAAFPLAPLLVNRNLQGSGATIGRIYFLNVAGNVAGGAITGFLLLPRLGSEWTLLLFTSINLAFLLPLARLGRFRLTRGLRVAAYVGLCAFAGLFGFGKGELVRALHPYDGLGESYFDEGVEGTVMTSVNGPKVVTYLNGQRHGGRPNPSFYVEAIEAAAFARSVERVLFIGYGTGSTLEALLKLPEVREVVLIELNATLMHNLQRAPLFRELLSDPRIHLIIDDGRRYLLSNDERFDMVLLDPLRTATAYSNNLYSHEFFDLVRQHLEPGGLVMLWQDEFDILPRTVASVFPHRREYSYFLLASSAPWVETAHRRDTILRGFDSETQRSIERSFSKLAPPRNVEGAGLVAGPINTDWKPRTEYYLGWSSRKYFAPAAGGTTP